MKGKVCIVTGANSGIGRATALALADAGATVVMFCRDEARGRAAMSRIAAQSKSQSIDMVIVDLASQPSVRAAASKIEAKYQRLDLLVNNAAVFTSKRIATQDGLELMFATNYLGPFLLTRLLLPLLTATGRSRIINVTAPSTIRPEFDDLQSERSFGAIGAYGASKSADLLFTFALARRLKEPGAVTVNAYHPGIVRTKLVRGAPTAVRLITTVLDVFMGVSPQRACVGLVQLASSTKFEGTTGALIRHGKVMGSPFEEDVEAQDLLWQASCKLTGLSETI